MTISPLLSPDERAFLENGRRATLATIAADGRPRLVPICYSLGRGTEPADRPVVYTPLDEKPKGVEDLRQLARVRDLLSVPEVVLLVDRWDEDWSALAWLRAYGIAALVEPPAGGGRHREHAQAIRRLRAKYPQYLSHRLEERPIIRIELDRVVRWGALER